MATGIVAGPLIAALNFSAGVAAFAAAVCLAMGYSGIRILGLRWLALMCFSSVGFQLVTGQFHLSTNLTQAAELQRWQSAWATAQLYTLVGYIVTYVQHPRRHQILLAMGVIVAVMLVMTFAMPLGGRFHGPYNSLIIEFPWGERLQALHGQMSSSAAGGRLLFAAVFFWGLVQVVKTSRDRTASLVLGGGLGLLTLSSAVGGLVETGGMNFVYFGGFGYIFLVLLVLYLVAREFMHSQQREQQTLLRLQNELENHQRTREEVEHLSFNDTLTGLPSRAGLFRELHDLLLAAQRQQKQTALLHIDLDRFDLINDSLGPRCGDRLLQQVALRMQEGLQREAYVARIGADEFICLLVAGTAMVEAEQCAQKIHQLMQPPFVIEGQSLHITASIGVAFSPADALQPDALLVAADLATREAKRQGRNRTCYYRREFDEAVQERLLMGNALRLALAEKQFELYFQPQVSADGHKVESLEALIRWHHPQGGLVEPSRFIPVAEEMQLITELGAWVVEEACRILAVWHRQGLQGLRVAVNLSAKQLHQPELVDIIRCALESNGLSGGDLELEITESMVMDDPEYCIEQLRRLSQMGIKIAMDDFGTGYSSLAYLKRLPIDTLKIDRSFVRDLAQGNQDATLCATTINMALNLGLETVAEGIETEAQADLLRVLKCDRFQGYLFARPMPAADVPSYYQSKK